MIVCGKHHVYCLYDWVETSLSDCSTLYRKQLNSCLRYLKIDNSAVRQYFQMKFCAYFTEYFRIKHTKFTQDAFRFHISVVHCVGFTFFRTQCSSLQSIRQRAFPDHWNDRVSAALFKAWSHCTAVTDITCLHIILIAEWEGNAEFSFYVCFCSLYIMHVLMGGSSIHVIHYVALAKGPWRK